MPGILNGSPIYFFALLGLWALARLRDRRVAVAVGFYAATAAINGLHLKWDFGFCFPARFLVTALPVLVLGLAWGLPLLLRAATASFLAAVALAISLEGVLNTLVLTETGYIGHNLLGRSINHFYPLHQHFFAPSQQDMPLLDIAFWALLAAALCFRPRHHYGLRWAVIAAAAFAPFLWSRSDVLAARLPQSLSPYMARLSRGIVPLEFKVPLHLSEEAAQPDGSLRARPGATSAGRVSSSTIRTPLLNFSHPGTYQLTFPGLRIEPPDDSVAGYLTVSHRYTAPAVALWGAYASHLLIGGEANGDYALPFEIDQPCISYVDMHYSGRGVLALDGIRAIFTPVHNEPQLVEVYRHALQDRPTQATILLSNLSPGHYRVRFNLTGSTFARFFERSPAPVRTAVYAVSGAPERLHDAIALWFSISKDPYNWTEVRIPDHRRPLQEGVHPAWWLSLPFAADRARQLRFALTRPQDVYLLLHYDGPADLGLTDIVLYRETFDQH